MARMRGIRDNAGALDFQRLRNYWIRISQHPKVSDLSPRDQALVSHGQIAQGDHGRGVAGWGHTGSKDS